jgi:hypothetical protein
MLRKVKLGLVVGGLLLSVQVSAGEVKVSDAWARATAPGQENGSVGVVITSQKDARLIGVTSTAAASAEIHTMSMDNGVMKMRQLEYLPLPANQPVKLGPGGDHLMLFGLKRALKAGDIVPLTITVKFSDQGTEKINIKALVQPLAYEKSHHHHE